MGGKTPCIIALFERNDNGPSSFECRLICLNSGVCGGEGGLLSEQDKGDEPFAGS